MSERKLAADALASLARLGEMEFGTSAGHICKVKTSGAIDNDSVVCLKMLLQLALKIRIKTVKPSFKTIDRAGASIFAEMLSHLGTVVARRMPAPLDIAKTGPYKKNHIQNVSQLCHFLMEDPPLLSASELDALLAGACAQLKSVSQGERLLAHLLSAQLDIRRHMTHFGTNEQSESVGIEPVLIAECVALLSLLNLREQCILASAPDVYTAMRHRIANAFDGKSNPHPVSSTVSTNRKGCNSITFGNIRLSNTIPYDSFCDALVDGWVAMNRRLPSTMEWAEFVQSVLQAFVARWPLVEYVPVPIADLVVSYIAIPLPTGRTVGPLTVHQFIPTGDDIMDPAACGTRMIGTITHSSLLPFSCKVKGVNTQATAYLVRVLQHDQLMFGVTECIRCNRTLTRPQSIADCLGSECKKRSFDIATFETTLSWSNISELSAAQAKLMSPARGRKRKHLT